MATVSDHKTLDCPLCFKRFTSPRVLPCYHTFCEKCLRENIELQVQGGTKFMCPLCAQATVPTDSSLAVDKWASAFPLNTVISYLASADDLDKGNENCGPCGIDGETKAAEIWCVECRETLCNPCYRSHQRMKPLQHHKTVPVDEMDRHIQANYNFDFDCGRHSEKVKLFCIDHKELCCAVCVATDHRQCNDVRSIDDTARDQLSTSDYRSIIRDLGQLKTEMEKILTEKKTNAKQVLQEKDQILHDMDNRIDTIITHLNKLRNAFRNETEQMYRETESSIGENQKSVQSFLTNIDNSSEILEVVEKSGTLQQKFTVFEHLRCQITSHYNQLNLRLKDDVKVHFSLKASKFICDAEETLKTVGSVEVSKKSSATSRDLLHGADKIIKNLNSRTKTGTEMCAAQVEKVKDLMTSRVTFVKSVAKDKLGSGTWLRGGTFLGNGRLVMCDYINKRLVEFDEEYNIVKEYMVDGEPSDVAAGNKDNEIYIAANRNYIYKCTLHTDLTIVSRIKAPSGTWGIAVNGDNIIVGTNHAVVILAQDGSTVRSIPKSGDISCVAVSQTQRTIYHRDNHNVVCRTWEGQEVFRYQHQQLKGPRGIFTDNKNVYICGMESYNVHQISDDGQRSRIILDKLNNISKPYVVVLHPQKNHLIVTSFDERTVIEIYRLA